MPKVAKEVVANSGLNVDEVVQLLVSNAAAELTTFYYYTILRVNLIGMEGEGLKQIAEDARIEDRNHFEALVPRIYELDGKLPESMVDFHNMSACPPARLPENPRDVTAIMRVLLEAERRRSSTRRGLQSSWERARRDTLPAAPPASPPSCPSSCISAEHSTPRGVVNGTTGGRQQPAARVR